jgi:hypothetical protein
MISQPGLPVLATLLIVSVACASRGAPAVTPSEASPNTSIPSTLIESAMSRWSFKTDSQPHQYQLTSTTTVRLDTDTSSRKDTIRTTVAFSLSITGDFPAQAISGEITHLLTEVHSRTGSTRSSPTLPIRFEGRRNLNEAELHIQGLPVRTNSTIQCGDSSARHLTSLYSQLNTIPQTINRSETWADSLSLQSCLGTIPIEIRLVRRYRVVGETKIANQLAILVQRTDSIQSAAEGSQGQHRVAIHGSGAADTQLYIEPRAGFLIASEGQRRTSFTIRTSGQQRKFTQQSTETVRTIR